jgi:hypothetical protein
VAELVLRQTKAARAVGLERSEFYIRWTWIGAGVAMLAADLRAWMLATSSGFVLPPIGVDLAIYRDAAARFLGGGSFYLPSQLAGPYDVWANPPPVLYPPVALPLFAAFTFLPAVLWWAIPLGIMAAVLRPRPAALPLIIGLVVWPSTAVNILWNGNPAMWSAAALALAVSGRAWAGPLILLKPTLAPFALCGIRHRSWWIGAAFVGLASLAFASLWLDYFRSLANAQNAGWTYQLWGVPVMVIPVLAWLGRQRGRPVK